MLLIGHTIAVLIQAVPTSSALGVIGAGVERRIAVIAIQRFRAFNREAITIGIDTAGSIDRSTQRRIRTQVRAVVNTVTVAINEIGE